MERISDDKIIIIINKLIKLLKENDEKFWSNTLDNLLHQYEISNSKPEVAKSCIKIMRGGMGSFLDLVLHKNGNPLIKENNQLDKLKHELYDECTKLQNKVVK